MSRKHDTSVPTARQALHRVRDQDSIASSPRARCSAKLALVCRTTLPLVAVAAAFAEAGLDWEFFQLTQFGFLLHSKSLSLL